MSVIIFASAVTVLEPVKTVPNLPLILIRYCTK